MFQKLSFAHLLGAVLALSFIVGFAVFVLSGATTNKGPTGAIGPHGPVASAGRSFTMPSPSKSLPVVMLNGNPELIVTNGAITHLKGNPKLPPTKPRFRAS